MSEFKIITQDEDDLYSSDLEEDDYEYDESRNIEMKNDIDIPFIRMRLDMHLIQHGIYKQIITEGTGDQVVVTSRVSFDYSGFWEGESTPFQTSWINRRPPTLKMGEDMLPGMYYCLLSMRLNEVAKFIVPYQLLYGVMGCAMDGIPERADGLYIIRVISVEDVGDSKAITEDLIEEYESYETVLERVQDVRKSARANFLDKKYEEAAKDFKKCIAALKYCHSADEEERDRTLETMYVNLCVCYNKLDRHLDVLKMRDELLKSLGTNAKAMFQMGRAHFRQADFQEALQYLARAQELEPNNKEVAQELKLVNEANEQYKRDIKEISRKAMQNNERVKEVRKDYSTNHLYKVFEDVVKNFVEDKRKEEHMLPINLDRESMDMIREIAEGCGVDGCRRRREMRPGST